MDLLFKRYASPFLFIDGMLQAGRFSAFVDDFMKTTNKEKEDQVNWEYYLHRVMEGSFNDFVQSLKNTEDDKNLSEATIETTVQYSLNLLNNFKPE